MTAEWPRWLGPPAPFPKVLVAMVGVFVLTYLDVRPIGATLLEILTSLFVLLVLGVILLGSLAALASAMLDFLRPVPAMEKLRALAALVLGYFAFDAMQSLAAKDETTYLAAFVAALSATLIALAVEPRFPRSGEVKP